MKRLQRFNESTKTVNYESVNFFDLIVEKIKKMTGWTVFSISKEENYCQIFNFKTKEDFDKNFYVEKHPIYPGNIVIPRTVIEENVIRNSKGFMPMATDTCIIDGEEFSLEVTELYLIVDGKLMR
jgi:hypothetical protein